MDTSETYIKQCEKAEEIQKNWKPSRGDWYIYKHNFKDHIVQIIGSEYQYAYSADFIWLPRQDQLQRMLLNNNLPDELCKITGYFNDFVLEVTPQFDSYEQLWHAFVMKEHRNKIWSAEKEEWIAGKK